MTAPSTALLALAALLFAGALPASQASSARPAHGHHAAAVRVSLADWQFMRRAAGLGQGAIAAGRLATARASHPALRDFGAVLAEEHVVLNRRLALLSLVKQVPLPSRPPKDLRKGIAGLRQLGGPAFDAAFMDQASAIEGRVIRLFQAEAAARATDPGLRSFAREFLPKLQAQERLIHDLQTHAAPVQSPAPG